MEIIIGRDSQTRQLCIIKNGCTKLFGPAGSVPMDVSRHHISLQPAGKDKWQIKNLNERNVTFVNGIAVESKTISESDKVELGNSHYLFPWDALSEPKVETLDISPLKKIWTEYDEQRLEFQIAERKFNAARSATGIITMVAIACSLILGHGPVYLILYALAIGISVVLTYQAYQKSSDVPRKQREINKNFQKRYVCPKCGHFMGFTDYDILIQNDACPYCKTKYKK
ncbi:MAG: FHA domain-containing protein [Prevotella sp.]|nr:FHA domain-containing protein [Prevotella sp.]